MKPLFLACALLLASNFAYPQTAQMVRDAEAIQTTLDNLSKAWNIHDPKAFSMGFSEDADFTNVRGMSAHGRDSIAIFHEKPFATWFSASNLKTTGKRIRFLTADIAAVDAWWEMTGAKTPDGKDVPLRKGLFNLVMTKDGENWLVTVMHNMDLPVAH